MSSSSSTINIPRKPVPQRAPANDSSNARLLPDLEKGTTVKSHRTPCASAYARYFEEWWLWELLSAIIGVLAMIAMCWLLSHYNNQRLPQWGSVFGADINLNAVLSLLGLLIKSSLMLSVLECISQLKWTWYTGKFRSLEDLHVFDNASRGPLGALQILYKVPRAHLALVGALLSVLSLALDPFIQQTVQYKSIRIDNSTSNALLPVVQDWGDASLQPQLGSPPISLPSFGMISTVTSALLEYGQSPPAKLTDIGPTCPTGNCTWPAAVSLGVCATTANVTSSLKTTKSRPLRNGLGGDFNASLHFDGVKLTVGAEGADLVLGMYTDFIPSAYNSYGFYPDYRINGSNSIALPEILNPLMHGWVIRQAGDPTGSQGSFEGKQDVHAIEYALEWCAQTYDTSVESGNNSIKLSPPDAQIAYGRFETMQRTAHPFLSAQALHPKEGVLAPNLTVDGPTHFSLVAWLQGLQGNVGLTYFHGITTPATQDPGNSNVDSNIFLSIHNLLKGEPSDPSLGSGFRPMLENVATSVTNRIRRLSDTRRAGTVYSYETHVHVRWAWISLPCCFTLFSLLFFIATVLHQQFSKTYVWKSSSSAILYALDPESKKAQGMMGKGTEMEARTKAVLARLENEPGKGWRLVTKEKAVIPKKKENGSMSLVRSSLGPRTSSGARPQSVVQQPVRPTQPTQPTQQAPRRTW